SPGQLATSPSPQNMQTSQQAMMLAAAQAAGLNPSAAQALLAQITGSLDSGSQQQVDGGAGSNGVSGGVGAASGSPVGAQQQATGVGAGAAGALGGSGGSNGAGGGATPGTPTSAAAAAAAASGGSGRQMVSPTAPSKQAATGRLNRPVRPPVTAATAATAAAAATARAHVGPRPPLSGGRKSSSGTAAPGVSVVRPSVRPAGATHVQRPPSLASVSSQGGGSAASGSRDGTPNSPGARVSAAKSRQSGVSGTSTPVSREQAGSSSGSGSASASPSPKEAAGSDE
ncbi:hypothetical protein IW150_006173, partial [Coemansia sp. RSA 2607]